MDGRVARRSIQSAKESGDVHISFSTGVSPLKGFSCYFFPCFSLFYPTLFLFRIASQQCNRNGDIKGNDKSNT